MIKPTIDLHMHTSFSDDGEYSPEEVVNFCHQQNITIMAIADHNSTKAIQRAQQQAALLNIICIPAIEIDCTFRGHNFHVLGYGIHPDNPVYEKIENNVLDQERANSLTKLQLTNNLGFDLKKEQLNALSNNGVYTGEMFAEALLKDPRYTDHSLLLPYREHGSRSDNPYVNFYWDYYAPKKACYTPMNYPSFQEVLTILKEDHAIAVLAHPAMNLANQVDLFFEMVAYGLDGVEAFSSYHTDKEAQYFYHQATRLGLLITCGSDFHGKTKPSIQLGQSHCTLSYESLKASLKQVGLI